jgi:hypothetical protein
MRYNSCDLCLSLCRVLPRSSKGQAVGLAAPLGIPRFCARSQHPGAERALSEWGHVPGIPHAPKIEQPDGKRFPWDRSPVASRIQHPVMALTGPPVLQQAAEECLKLGSAADILRHTQIVCISGNVVQLGGKRNARLWKSVLFTRAARVTDVITDASDAVAGRKHAVNVPSLGPVVGRRRGDTSPCPVQGKCSDGSALPHFRLGLSHEAAAVANFPKVWSRVDREVKASLKIGRTRIQANQISATQGNPEYLWANRTQAGEHPS